ncbi:uncharacterized protein VP01_551g2 [Puccinia sorghi]|uniref:Uncharacterized protein n=1 Tax=Puccinia sorghi TaxID=27349 RepID=A0A0L6UJA5_9BASI|nr:uncharacterized protein VP01_551g2 [Puccinia sorghi]
MTRGMEARMERDGTGTSGQVPSIGCLTEPNGQGCRCCGSRDRKDQRRNTSALVRILNYDPPAPLVSKLPHQESNFTRNILIDVGKSFCEAAREHFPKHRIRKLDAVLLTHPQ